MEAPTFGSIKNRGLRVTGYDTDSRNFGPFAPLIYLLGKVQMSLTVPNRPSNANWLAEPIQI